MTTKSFIEQKKRELRDHIIEEGYDPDEIDKTFTDSLLGLVQEMKKEINQILVDEINLAHKGEVGGITSRLTSAYMRIDTYFDSVLLTNSEEISSKLAETTHETHVRCHKRLNQKGGKAECCHCVPHSHCGLTKRLLPLHTTEGCEVCEPKKFKSLSDFSFNATPKEKKEVLEQVVWESALDQQKVIWKAELLRKVEELNLEETLTLGGFRREVIRIIKEI